MKEKYIFNKKKLFFHLDNTKDCWFHWKKLSNCSWNCRRIYHLILPIPFLLSTLSHLLLYPIFLTCNTVGSSGEKNNCRYKTPFWELSRNLRLFFGGESDVKKIVETLSEVYRVEEYKVNQNLPPLSLLIKNIYNWTFYGFASSYRPTHADRNEDCLF